MQYDVQLFFFFWSTVEKVFAILPYVGGTRYLIHNVNVILQSVNFSFYKKSMNKFQFVCVLISNELKYSV